MVAVSLNDTDLELETRFLMKSAQSFPDISDAARWFSADYSVCSRYVVAAREHHQTAEDAIPFLRSTCVWRDEMAVDSMIADESLQTFETELRQHVLLYSLCDDKLSRPLLIERVGAWDLDTIHETILESRESVLRAHVLVSERIRRRVDDMALADAAAVAAAAAAGAGAPPDVPADRRATLIFDAAGLPWAMLRFRSLHTLFGEMSRLDAAHFPNTIGTIFIINVSRVASAAWAVLSHLVATQTRLKVRIFSWSQMEAASKELCERCGAEHVPAELGGRRQDSSPYHYRPRSSKGVTVS